MRVIILAVKVAELGEFALVDLLADLVASSRSKRSKSWRQVVLGIGDDAAVWTSDRPVQMATVDSLVEGVHFTAGMGSWRDLGWKALAINLSDIAAMGGVPRYALVSLAMPGVSEVDDVTYLYKGMIELGDQFDVAIVGGDTDCAEKVSITVTVFGDGSQGKTLLTRSSGRPGDKIAVTGTLGGAAGGFRVLKEKMVIDREATSALTKAFLRPWPRVSEGQTILRESVRTAIDISDGLVSDLTHICHASNVGARLRVDRVPVHPALERGFGEGALALALSGGEDYELLFAADEENIEKVRRAVACPVTIVGELVAENAGEVTLVDAENRPYPLPTGGWEHFRSLTCGKES